MSTVSDLRKALGLSQVQLAERAGVSQSVISRVEDGAGATTATAIRLARVLGTSVEELFGATIDDASATDDDADAPAEVA